MSESYNPSETVEDDVDETNDAFGEDDTDIYTIKRKHTGDDDIVDVPLLDDILFSQEQYSDDDISDIEQVIDMYIFISYLFDDFVLVSIG